MSSYTDEQILACYDDMLASVKTLLKSGKFSFDNKRQEVRLSRALVKTFPAFSTHHALRGVLSSVQHNSTFSNFVRFFGQMPKQDQDTLIANGFDDVIKEYEKSNPNVDKKPEAPLGAPFGLYAFAEQRDDVPEEKNTAIENETIKAILDMAYDEGKVPAHVCSVLRACMKNGYYRSMIHGPSVMHLYRGLTLNPLELANIINVPEQVILNDTHHTYGTYKSNVGVPWATRASISLKFASGMTNYNPEGKSLHVMFRANIADNEHSFLEYQPFREKKLIAHNNEGEVVGLGDINYDFVVWARDYDTLRNLWKKLS